MDTGGGRAMSLKDYNNLDKEIQRIYTETCIPCMRSFEFRKGDCKTCDTMNDYTTLQERKRAIEVED